MARELESYQVYLLKSVSNGETITTDPEVLRLKLQTPQMSFDTMQN